MSGHWYAKQARNLAEKLDRRPQSAFTTGCAYYGQLINIMYLIIISPSISLYFSMIFFSGICIAKSLKISRLATDEEFDEIIRQLLDGHKARAVVMFVNEDNCRKLLKTLKRSNSSTELTFLASDSWGAKIHPVYGQELVAEGAVTLLPKRRVIKGNICI